jgi:hypothetical protein
MTVRVLVVPALVLALLTADSSMGVTLVHSSSTSAIRQATSLPLFSVGIQGGFTGIIMDASVYADGRVTVTRQGGGRSTRTAETTVPLSVSAVKLAVKAARTTGVFSIPKSVQNATFGADVPVRVLRILDGTRIRTVRAMGSEVNHVRGAGSLFPVWGLLYALAGYPAQVG